ncbi:MAG: heavy metal translocating P-type ATPase [Candidatus Pacebacteria bacterium]|nr:heavy metal translocating P-type ATPase [Candidatus Paceibacterota bacterium]
MTEFLLPLLVLLLTAAGIGIPGAGGAFYLAAITVGLAALVIDSVRKLFVKQFSLDYIAILAMVVAVATNELLAGAVISLMILVSESLEAYGSREAEAALKHLVEKIPKTCQVKRGEAYAEAPIQDVREGDTILIRANEIVPLDGYLLSEDALMNEANLTGEFAPRSYRKGQFLKSGLVNEGASLELRVSGDFGSSTYQKIVDLVREAKRHPARIVRLAEKYNYGFTAITLLMAGAAYVISHGDPTRLLAVLVMATPCPLIIAAPISFLGGLNVASKKNVIVKRPAALETLSEVTAIFFDKTGTLTLGEPTLRAVRVLDPAYSEDRLLSIAAAIELHSLHPLAKTIVAAHNARADAGAAVEEATHIVENVGDGIAGAVGGGVYRLKKSDAADADGEGGIVIEMSGGGRAIARFILDDVMKPGTMALLEKLRARYHVAILTGDTEANAARLFDGYGTDGLAIHARCTPAEKFRIVKEAQARGEKVMMVGDGLNDAPALALADVGVVFSGTENSASIDAASVAILSRDIALVQTTLAIAARSTRVAKESILWGIGLSVIGMAFALLGYIPPVTGAVLQEGIDASVIMNALRAARARG